MQTLTQYSFPKSVLKKLLLRKKTSHKGEHGKLLIIGGSQRYPGAILLAAKAAYRLGVDWITALVPKGIKPLILCHLPDVIVEETAHSAFTKKDLAKAKKLAKEHNALLLGPGIGRATLTLAFAKAVAESIAIAKVIDADALRSVNLKHLRMSILTPHLKEFASLLSNASISEEQLQQSLINTIIIKKGHHDLIMSRTRMVVNKTGNPGMTVAGTGDVLAGAIASILAQTEDLFWSAAFGVWLVGKAGDEAKKHYGYGFMASDLIEVLPTLVKKVIL